MSKFEYRYDAEWDDADNPHPGPDEMSEARRLGGTIYMQALSDRRGFRNDQIGIDDVDIWAEIFEAIGQTALASLTEAKADD